MDLETQQNPAPGIEHKNDDRKIQALRDQLSTQISQSTLSAAEKLDNFDWLASDPKSFDAQTLQTWIEQLPKSEEFRKETLKAYETKFDRAASQNLVSRDKRRTYLEWAEKLSTGDLMKYLLKDDLDRPERVQVLEQFKLLPAAVRKELEPEFNKSGLEERLKLVNATKIKHEELKTAFLSLPKNVQAQYRTQFKALGLKDREKLLEGLHGVNISGNKEKRETAERQELLHNFEAQHIEGVNQNLFAPLSIPPNLAWAKTLSLERLRDAVTNKKSDLYVRMDERIKTRDAFYDEAKIPASKRGPWELKFRNADLDKRKEILQTLTVEQSEKEDGPKISYPQNVMRRTLETTLADPEMAHLRMLYTLSARTFRLRRRAELRLEAKHTKDLAEKAAERGNEVDDFDVFHLEGLEHHADQRFALKRFHVEKLADGDNAVANNMRLLNREKREVSAEQFETQIVDHIEGELLAKLLDRASQKLPQANRDDMRRLAHKLDFSVNLTEARSTA